VGVGVGVEVEIVKAKGVRDGSGVCVGDWLVLNADDVCGTAASAWMGSCWWLRMM
jgi:hypothetical protein